MVTSGPSAYPGNTFLRAGLSAFGAQLGRYQRSGGSGAPKTNHQTPGMALLRGRMSTMRTTAIVSAIPARRTKKNEWLHRSQ